jgi:hypothetical protein
MWCAASNLLPRRVFCCVCMLSALYIVITTGNVLHCCAPSASSWKFSRHLLQSSHSSASATLDCMALKLANSISEGCRAITRASCL